MRNRTFFAIVIGCFIAGMTLAYSFTMTPGSGSHSSRAVAWMSK